MNIAWLRFVVICGCCLSTTTAGTLQKISNDIFSFPAPLIDEEDLLEEHGRFMLANMNLSVDPCENFHEYACGNWKNDQMVPTLGQDTTSQAAMSVKVNELILEYLKNKTISAENTAERKMKDFFDSCINTGQDLKLGYQTISNSIKEPVLKEGETLDWMTLNFYWGYMPAPLLPLYAVQNDTSLVYEIYIDRPEAYLNSSSFNFTKISEDFKFEDEEAMKQEWEELLTFEKKLVESVTDGDDEKQESLKEFLRAHNSSDLNFERFFDLAFNGTVRDSWKINYSIKDFTKLNKFLKSSDIGVILKYVRWKIILKFYKIIVLSDEETIEENCSYVTTSYFRSAFLPWFIETAFDKERRTDALRIAKRVKESFNSLIEQSSWMDSETKSSAKSKLRAMDVFSGYTDEMLDRSKIEKQFEKVRITKSLWENLMSLDAKKGRDKLKTIGKAEHDLNFPTNVVNAFYSPLSNQAFVTVGLTQLPMYHINLPNSLKFGGIGSVIGHEMAHGFDTLSYKYDYDGRERNWWSAESLRNYEERYQCLESQYNKFIFEGKKANGNLTSGDDIADNVGLQIAYRAYLRFLEENGNVERAKDKPLPGVDLTNKHLFFLKFAQNWCDGRSVTTRLSSMEYNEHSLHEFRVIGTLMNMPEFSEVFNCALGTNMNPLKKCIIFGDE